MFTNFKPIRISGIPSPADTWDIIQSREYQKQVGDEEYETRIAYEISVSKLERVEESGEVIAASEISEEDGEETLDL